MDGHQEVVVDTEVVDMEVADTEAVMVVDNNNKLKLLKLLYQVLVLAKDGPEVVQVEDTPVVVDILATKDGPAVEDTPAETKDGLTVVVIPVEIKDGPVAEA